MPLAGTAPYTYGICLRALRGYRGDRDRHKQTFFRDRVVFILAPHVLLIPSSTTTTPSSTPSSSDRQVPPMASPPERVPASAPATSCPPCRAAVPPAAPRSPSPAHVGIDPRMSYAPPSQTTLRAGRVTRPSPRDWACWDGLAGVTLSSSRSHFACQMLSR